MTKFETLLEPQFIAALCHGILPRQNWQSQEGVD